jgi:hypothetical protein
MRKFFVAFVVLVLTLGAAFSADNPKRLKVQNPIQKSRMLSWSRLWPPAILP